MNPRVHFAIHILIGIAALAMLVYAFFQPLGYISINENDFRASYDMYFTKECLSISGIGISSRVECRDLSDISKPHMQAIMGIVIALMICILLEFIGMNFNGLFSNVFGLLVLALSISLICLVATITIYNYTLKFYNETKNTYYYKLTNTSIGILIVASLLVLFQLCCNKLVHRAVLAPYRLIAGKKA
jgi:hypothetical protein